MKQSMGTGGTPVSASGTGGSEGKSEPSLWQGGIVDLGWPVSYLSTSLAHTVLPFLRSIRLSICPCGVGGGGGDGCRQV